MSLATITSFVHGLQQSQLLDAGQSAEVERILESSEDARALARELLRREWLTAFQINQIFQGKGASLVLGPYILMDRLGEGGMGQVYKARQKMLNRLVALKVIRKDCLDVPKITQRFLREIRAASQLSHPHIVHAFDADSIQGTYYFAMELIDGVDLSRLVKAKGPLRVEQACEYIRQAALGLQHAHERGLVHRDIKPANLLVTRSVPSDRRRSSGCIRRPPELVGKKSQGAIPLPLPALGRWGTLKILDLGLVRYSDPFLGRAATHLTQVGSVMGTPEYIAPEQARDSTKSDIRSDLYSLGCTFYFLLAGQAPFPKGTLTEKLLQHQMNEPASLNAVRRERSQASQGSANPEPPRAALGHVPKPIVDVVSRLMAKCPEDRFQTPQDLANTLQELLQQMAVGTLPLKETNETTILLEEPTLTPARLPTVELVPTASSTVLQPIVVLAAPPLRARRNREKWLIALALLVGSAFALALLTVAILARRHQRHDVSLPARSSSIIPWNQSSSLSLSYAGARRHGEISSPPTTRGRGRNS